MKNTIIATLALVLFSSIAYAEDFPPYSSYKMDELEKGESYSFGADLQGTRGGMKIVKIYPGGAADRQGFEVGDVITQVGNTSKLTARNVTKAFNTATDSDHYTHGYVYIAATTQERGSIHGIVAMSHKRSGPNGDVYEDQDVGYMIKYLGQMNAAVLAFGQPWDKAPQDDMSYAVKMYKTMASMYRLINTDQVPEELATRQAEVIAAIKTMAFTAERITPNTDPDEGLASINRANTKLEEKMQEWGQLLFTYNEIRKQEAKRRGDE